MWREAGSLCTGTEAEGNDYTFDVLGGECFNNTGVGEANMYFAMLGIQRIDTLGLGDAGFHTTVMVDGSSPWSMCRCRFCTPYICSKGNNWYQRISTNHTHEEMVTVN